MREYAGIMAAVVALALCLVAASVQAEGIKPDIRPGDPVIARADVVYFDTSANSCTRGMLCAQNGDLIVSIGTKGDGEPTKEISTKFVRSSDQGKTWKLYLTSKTNKPLTGLGNSFFGLPAGRILSYSLELVWPGDPKNISDYTSAEYGSLAGGRKLDSYYSISEDNGYTFSESKPLTDPASNPAKRMDFAQGPIVELKNGDLLWSWGDWGSPPLNGFKRSTDKGLTWGPMERAFQDPPPGVAKPLVFNETVQLFAKTVPLWPLPGLTATTITTKGSGR